jgi:CheY-like chemotaxis protein
MPDQATRNPAIVLVEDEPDILIILHRLMRDLTGGYDIVTVNGGAEALAQIALRPVPLVITDYNMPGMNGLQLTAAIKETSPGSSRSCGMCCARAREQETRAGVPRGAPALVSAVVQRTFIVPRVTAG